MKRSRYSIGKGTQHEFPIVREGNVSNHVAVLSVGAESFIEALRQGVNWAWNYSASEQVKANDDTLSFWPLVRRGFEKFYAKKVGNGYVWIESKTEGFWTPLVTLEAL